MAIARSLPVATFLIKRELAMIQLLKLHRSLSLHNYYAMYY